MEDFKSAHLTWLKNTKDFVPYGGVSSATITYYDIMHAMYYNKDFFPCSQEVAESMFKGDKKHYAETKKLIYKLTHKPRIAWITIGFNRENFNTDKAVKFMHKLKSCNWILDYKGVIEFHGKTGFRPHCHILIEYSEAVKHLSDVSNRLYKILCTKPFHGLVLASNHIEYMYGEDHHEEYVKGNKRVEKLDFVISDRVYRNQHHIPHIFQK